MRTARLFRTIWRLNGVLLLLAFVLVGGLALVAATSSVVSSRHRDRAAPAAVIPETDQKLFIGSVENVDGSSFVLLPLEARGSGAGLSSGKSYSSET